MRARKDFDFISESMNINGVFFRYEIRARSRILDKENDAIIKELTRSANLRPLARDPRLRR